VKPRNRLIDVATILSSLLLVTAFICYRSGVFNRLLAESPQPAAAPGAPTTLNPSDAISAPGEVHHAPSQERITVGSAPGVPVIMSGTKSSFATVIAPVANQPTPPPPMTPPAATPQAPHAASPPEPILLDTSKSGKIFFKTTIPTPPAPHSPAPPPAPVTSPPPPVFMGGTKSPGFAPIQGLTPAPAPAPAPVQQAAPQSKP
jgi:hypothetical protein